MRSVGNVERALELYGDAVMGLACALLRSEADAFDVTQETFARYFTSDKVFKNEHHEKNWLLKVAGNLCRDELRKARRRHERPVGLSIEKTSAAITDSKHPQAFGSMITANPAVASPAAAHYEPTPDFDEDHTVWEYVGRLSPSLRQMIHLRYAEELDIDEIADILEMTKVNVRVSLHRARKQLREMMESREDGQKGEGNA